MPYTAAGITATMNIQRHASSPSHSSSDAPPADVASSWSDSRAAKIPSVMASCCSDPSRPRMAAGAISAMYAGAMTDAMPMPMPAMMRHSTRSQTPNAMPDRIEETKNRTAPRNITRVRPQRSASLPPSHAPNAQPSRAMATTSPVTAGSISNSPSIASTAPLMTELSKPKRKPPTAAATARPMALFLYGCGGTAEPPVAPCGDAAWDMICTSVGPRAAPGEIIPTLAPTG